MNVILYSYPPVICWITRREWIENPMLRYFILFSNIFEHIGILKQRKTSSTLALSPAQVLNNTDVPMALV